MVSVPRSSSAICARLTPGARAENRALSPSPRAESDAALKEIAKLLQQTPTLKLFVVGHTDGVGTLASNMDLSKRRADAVVAALTTKYGVAAARLVAQGCGPLAPVVSNASEDGRAKNRRVELVAQ